MTKISQTQHHLSERDVVLSVNAIVDLMTETMSQKNGRIEIRDFGNFSLRYRAPRKAHNPKTGEALTTEAKHAIHFKPGKGMKERINASRGTTPIHYDSEESEE